MTPMTVERALFARYVGAALGPRVRITKDADGWPLAPGRMGRLEWRGAERDSGEHRLYCYTSRRRIIAKLRAVPGVHPAQIGDDEAAFWIPAGDAQAVRGGGGAAPAPAATSHGRRAAAPRASPGPGRSVLPA